MEIRDKNFFCMSAKELAPLLVGKLICTDLTGEIKKLRISETECYYGEEDKACHASHGKTKRTATLYKQGGIAYVYLVYGMHNLVNVVSGDEGHPEAVLIRACADYDGPAKLTKALGITREQNELDLIVSHKLWFEDDGYKPEIITMPRVGIDYAGEYWASVPWRFVDKSRTARLKKAKK